MRVVQNPSSLKSVRSVDFRVDFKLPALQNLSIPLVKKRIDIGASVWGARVHMNEILHFIVQDDKISPLSGTVTQQGIFHHARFESDAKRNRRRSHDQCSVARDRLQVLRHGEESVVQFVGSDTILYRAGM